MPGQDLGSITFGASQPIASGVEITLGQTSPVAYLGGNAELVPGQGMQTTTRYGALGLGVVVYGAEVAVKVYCQSSSSAVQITAEGQLVTDRQGDVTGGSAGGTRWVHMAFETDGPHRLEIFGHEVLWLAIAHAADGAATALTQPTGGIKLAVLGDSFSGGANGVRQMNVWASQIGPLIGQARAAIDGQGGTGYMNAGAESWKKPFTDETRLARVVAENPTDIVVMGSVNDGGSTLAEIKAAASAVFAYFLAHAPEARIHVILPQPGTLTTQNSAGQVTNRQAVREAAQESQHVYTIIDGVADGWLTEANRTRFLSSDGVHLTQEGHDYITQIIAARLAPSIIPGVGASGAALPPEPLPIINTYASDTFTRADGAIGSTEDGKLYKTGRGTLLVVSGVAKASTITNTTLGAFALVDAGAADVSIEVTVGGGTWGMGVALRYSEDVSTGYIVSANTSEYQLQYFTGGIPTKLAGWNKMVAADQELRVTVNGDGLFSVYVNGVLLGTHTDTVGTGTWHGLSLQNTSRTLDNLKITSLPS